MRFMRSLIFLFALVAISSSCSKEVFTQTMRSRVEDKNTSDLERLQFYNDKRIVLVYTTSTKDNSIKAGKIEFVDGIYRYYVEIPRLTPCIAEPYNKNVLKVFFEAGQDHYLLFEEKKDVEEGMHKSYKGRYQLAISKQDDGIYVRFEGKKFRLVEGEGTVLLIDKNFRFEDDTERRKLKGVRVE